METIDVDAYLKPMSVKQLKALIGLYHKPRSIKIGKMKKNQLLELCKVLMAEGVSRKDRKTPPRKYGSGLMDFFKSPKKAYNNVSTNTIKKYGNSYIQSMKVVRTPIMGILNKALDVISFGQFSKHNPYDKLFHLALIADIGGQSIVIEKNEVINISMSYKVSAKTEQMKVYLKKAVTLNDLLANTEKSMGVDRFFLYDGLKNNCQNFVISVLKANGMSNPTVDKFVLQDLTQLRDKLPSHVGKAMNAVTDLGARANAAMGGGIGDLLDESGDHANANFNTELQNALHKDREPPTLKSGSKKDREAYRVAMNAYNAQTKDLENMFKEEYKGQINKKIDEKLIAEGYTKDKNGVWRKPASLDDVPLFAETIGKIPGMKAFANRAITAGERLYEKPSLSTALDAGKVLVDSFKQGANVAKSGDDKVQDISKKIGAVKSAIGAGKCCPTCGSVLAKSKGGGRSLYNTRDFI